ncbi:hypothetical protein [Brevundimonas diminuta]|uniref:hypothetical protein n=1 Tax=Brevundimonas diminuta TaxID=293 RepID=UPI0030FC9BC5
MAAIDVPARSRRPIGLPNIPARIWRGLLRWYQDIAASHRACLAEREIRLRRKLALNPVTPAQLRFYRLLIWGAACVFGLAIMETTS